jgi:transposase
MSTAHVSTQVSRYVALDVHRSYLVVGAVDSQQHLVLSPRRFGFESFAAWAPTHLNEADAVVLEASANAWVLYDQLEPLVGQVTVAHPLAVKLISAARVKTDARDTIKLARLLAANLIPAVWVPPLPVREVRALVTHRKRLVQQRIQARNRLQGVLQRHNLDAPEGKAFARGARDWWLALPLSMAEQLRVRQDLALLDALDPLITEVETHLGQLSITPAWSQQGPFLLQLPGLGMVCAMTILAAVGDISRFPTAKQFGGYAGLGARIHASGQVQRSGGITKEGRSELRTVMVEAAWVAVEYHPHWKGLFERLSARIGKHKAIVAIARKLLVAVWHVLSRQCADIHAEAQAVARTLLRWTARCGTTPGKRRSQAALLRHYLDQLGLGEGVEEIHYSGRVYRLSGTHWEGETT